MKFNGSQFAGSDEKQKSAFASDLGFAPGQWPDSFVVVGRKGFAFTFYRRDRIANGEELGGFTYRTLANEYQIEVFND